MAVLGLRHHDHLELNYVGSKGPGSRGEQTLMGKTVVIKIKRQENPGAASRWKEFELTWKRGMNVISAMMEIAANPVTPSGQATTPITYHSNCLAEASAPYPMLGTDGGRVE